ncbi:hypothetical protein DIPPA_32629 [Diplonema papillatum]|nr:hypothetical protein DIPPA_32629 [Diplonema papillatum]
MCEVGLLLDGERLFLGTLADIRRYAEAHGREVKLVERARSREADYDGSDLLDAICSVIQSVSAIREFLCRSNPTCL